MRVLVTGGAGYIGSHTTLALLQAGHDVLVVDDLSNSSPESLRRVADLSGRTPEFVLANVRDEAALDGAFTSFAPDAVIHFAGWKAVGESTRIPLTYYRENLESTITLLEVMAKHGVRGSVSLNVAVCDHYPEIIERCSGLGWELFSHGTYNTRYFYNLSEDQQRAVIADSRETILKYSGQSLDGWLTPEFIAAHP